MAYTEKQKKEIVNSICSDISKGMTLNKACNQYNIQKNTFYSWIDEDEKKMNQYARATKDRADSIFEEILDIADETINDFKIGENGEYVDHEAIQRSKLRVDTRKWMLGKMNPKKYGDKIQTEHSGAVGFSSLSDEELKQKYERIKRKNDTGA